MVRMVRVLNVSVNNDSSKISQYFEIYKTATDRARQEGGCAVGSDGETERRKEDLSDR